MPLSMEHMKDVEPVDQSEAFISSDDIADRFHDQITGKTILITGVSPGGIGAAAALSLARGHPKLLILAGRNMEKVRETIEDVRHINNTVSTRALELDLSSLKSVTQAAIELFDIPYIDILLANAGIMACPYGQTTDGLEKQFGTNHIGHFHLIRLLLPKLQASPDGGRVVTTSSIGHRLSGHGISFSDPNFEKGGYERWDAYAQSKTANILLAEYLSRHQLVAKAFSIHPGTVSTHLIRGKEVEEDIKALGENIPVKTPKQGASTLLRAALDPALEGFCYLEDCRVSKAAGFATDPGESERLWELSDRIVEGIVKARPEVRVQV